MGIILGYCSPDPFFRGYLFRFHETVKDISFIKIVKNNAYVIVHEVLGGILLLPVVNSLLFSGFALGLTIKSLITFGIGLKKVSPPYSPPRHLRNPAIIIAGAAGFKIPYEIIRYLMGRKEQPLTKEDIKEYLTLALISIILIVIAAWIEANVTPRIAEYFLTKGI